MSIWDLSEFSLVSYDLILILTLFRCRLTVKMRREASVYLLVHNSTILLGRGLGMSISDLSEFSFVSHDLILILTLIMCSSMAPRRREACVHPLLHNSAIFLGVGLGMSV
jgi:hypothetical protein